MKAIRKPIWVNILFFSFITIMSLVAFPIYVYHYGISGSEWVLFLLFSALTGMSITVGYHRLFAHTTYKAHPIVEFFILFFGAGAFEQSALDWASQHRDHHRYVDTDLDPYSIKKGFFYAHIGWMILWKHTINYDNAKDLQKNTMLMNQARYYPIWAITSGVVLPVLLGALTGHALGAFLFAVCLRLVCVYNATFCINSVCHMFGKSTYDIYATAKDNWFTALFTNGEGYHNFHHRFPNDYRNGVRWYQWDPSKWAILVMRQLGLVTDLKRASRFQILQARIAAEKQTMMDQIERLKEAHDWRGKFNDMVHAKHDLLIARLADWEKSLKDYHALVSAKAAHASGEWQEWKKKASSKLAEAKAEFERAHRDWDILMRNPVLA